MQRDFRILLPKQRYTHETTETPPVSNARHFREATRAMTDPMLPLHGLSSV
jgi:hypothetical protein